ncbi:jg19951 [Pararge aegeria aegeria]|uniref:Jg19951 protein n=2 Tax=Pararge aegeria TaxID=116150 RepID=A0A8S4S2W8_9NEOP|nr:jg19951 [Pararge aegeria aegeria]
MGCRARVRYMAGKLVASGDEHNHAPPSHARCGNGAFVQLRPRSQILKFPPITSAILPSPITSPRAASLALHALNFPRILPKTDLWPPPAEEKKEH